MERGEEEGEKMRECDGSESGGGGGAGERVGRMARRHPGAHAAGGDEEVERLQHVARVHGIVVRDGLVSALNGGQERDEALLCEPEYSKEVAVIAQDDAHGGERTNDLLPGVPAHRGNSVGGVEPLGHGVRERKNVEFPDEALLEHLCGGWAGGWVVEWVRGCMECERRREEGGCRGAVVEEKTEGHGSGSGEDAHLAGLPGQSALER